MCIVQTVELTLYTQASTLSSCLYVQLTSTTSDSDFHSDIHYPVTMHLLSDLLYSEAFYSIMDLL